MKLICLCVLAFISMTTSTYAGRPLVTDDVGTQGKGRHQIEMGVSIFQDKHKADDGSTIKTSGGETAMTYAFGLMDKLDLALGVPYAWFNIHENGSLIARADGLADINFDIKWRYFEKNGWALALKPGLRLPSGREADGLGMGITGYRVFMIGTKEFTPAVAHVNVGYIRNENNLGAHRDIWHISGAVEYELIESLKVMADIGIQRNPVAEGTIHPVFALGGVTYRIMEHITLDAAVRFGLTEPETDITYIAGLTIKF